MAVIFTEMHFRLTISLVKIVIQVITLLAYCRWYSRKSRAVPTNDGRPIDDTLAAVGNPDYRSCFTIYGYVLHRYSCNYHIILKNPNIISLLLIKC